MMIRNVKDNLVHSSIQDFKLNVKNNLIYSSIQDFKLNVKNNLLYSSIQDFKINVKNNHVHSCIRTLNSMTRIPLYTQAPNNTAYKRWSCHKQVWICDICHKQIHGRKQIFIQCNMIEHWVHLRCAGICETQYTDTLTCHLHRESGLRTHTEITQSHPSRPWR